MTEQDRRGSERHLACFPAHVQREGDGKRSIALIHDLSVTGAQLYTRSEMEIGARIALSLYVTGPTEPHETQGSIVRVESRGEAETWPFLVGVHFDAPLTHLEGPIKELAAYQAKLGINE